MNGGATRQEGLKYRELGGFRRKYIPLSNEPPSEPYEYTRMGENILFNCPISRDYQGLNFKIDYTAKPTDLLNGAVASELPDSNKGLILYALADVYDEIALSQPKFENKALKTRVLFDRWLDDYMNTQEMLIEEQYNE